MAGSLRAGACVVAGAAVTVAVTVGVAAGAGLSLLSSCSLVVASAAASFGGGSRVVRRELEQVHMALALEGVAQTDAALFSLQAFTSTLSTVVSNIVGLAVTLVAMLTLSWQLTLAALEATLLVYRDGDPLLDGVLGGVHPSAPPASDQVSA